jgi:SEC-C motif
MDRAETLANVPCPCGSGETFARCLLARSSSRSTSFARPLTALRAAGVAPEFVYAYERTGLIVVSTYRDRFSAADLDEWDDAVAEYRETHPAS